MAEMKPHIKPAPANSYAVGKYSIALDRRIEPAPSYYGGSIRKLSANWAAIMHRVLQESRRGQR